MLVASSIVRLSGELGESDCELIGDGFLGQPVNALTSGAYVLFGIWLVGRALRSRSNELTMEVVYGLTLASVGIGSIAFHGPAPPGARFLHDVTIAAVLAIIAARNLVALSGPNRRRVLALGALIIAAVGSVMTFAPDAGNVLTGVVGAIAVVSEAILYRTGRHRFSSRVARILSTMVLLLVAAAMINLLGRTGGPMCDPESIFQGHGLWHILTAAAFMLYGYAAFPKQVGDPEHAHADQA